MMILELLTMSSYVMSSVLYILICMVANPTMQLTSGTVSDKRRDFIHGSRVQLAFFISVSTPLIVLIWVLALEQNYVGQLDSNVKPLYWAALAFLLIYKVLNVVIFFADPISIEKSDKRNR